MNAQEAMVLVRYVKALKPAQEVDEYTSEAWRDVLADVDLRVAKEAVKRVAAVSPWISPDAVINEVVRSSNERLQAFQYDTGDDWDEMTGAEYCARRRQQITDTLSGRRPAVPDKYRTPYRAEGDPNVMELLTRSGEPAEHVEDGDWPDPATVTPQQIREIRSMGKLGEFFRWIKAGADTVGDKERRRMVLAHPDLAEQVAVILGISSPLLWDGRLPAQAAKGQTSEARARLIVCVRAAEARAIHDAVRAKAEDAPTEPWWNPPAIQDVELPADDVNPFDE